MDAKCDTCAIVRKALEEDPPGQKINTDRSRREPRLNMAGQWEAVGVGYGGAVGYTLLSDVGVSQIDVMLNRQNLPVDQRVKTWVDAGVAVGVGIQQAMYPLRSRTANDALFAAGIAAVVKTTEVGESFAKIGPYGKRYTAVGKGGLRQTPNYKPQRTAF